jgi:type I restriction enzyme R subunit
LIDRQLAKAGWSDRHRNTVEEYILKAPSTRASDSQEASTATDEFADYVLLGSQNTPLAIVEAKRSSRDAMAGKRQAADYGDRIRAEYGFDPFIFLANGEEIWFWDREASAPYKVSGFFTRGDLERLVFLRQYRSPLNQLGPNRNIVDRAYQIEAIKRITEALDQGQRHFLLVMATGTGKTRTVVALVDLLMRARRVQRVLFLVDRRELARQAMGDFKEHIPHESCERIEGKIVENKARIHVATYPSMMQVYRHVSPGFYDLIIADESHRSIYNRYKVLLDHFAGMQLGMTATPTDYIEHNTFELFNCPDGLPTFYYPYEQAVEENHLTPYRVLEAQTAFQLQGIKAGQLPIELQRQLEEKGIDLAELNFEGSDLERRVTNSGTNDAIVHEFFAKCRKDASGTLPAKTIIFAMSHLHAVELLESFRRIRPDLQRRGLAEVIDSHMERAEKTLEDFKHKDMPRVAISVDMLDTGIDVPAIQNLVFAKPVFSYVKFWQMIGRGTRLYEDKTTGTKKDSFLVIDHWNNFNYFQLNPEGEKVSTTEALPVRLFRERLAKLDRLRGRTDGLAIAEAVKQLQQMLAALPADNINVRPHLGELAELAHEEAWLVVGAARSEHISRVIAPLLRFLSDINLQVMIFEVRTERLANAYLDGRVDEVDKLRQHIIDDLKLLPTTLPQVEAELNDLVWMTGTGFWEHLDYARIMQLQSTFAPLMRYQQPQRREIIRLTLPDKIVSRRWIIYGPSGEGAFAESYREQVEAQVRRMADELPALHKLRQGEELDEAEMQTISDALNGPDLFITEETLREVYERPDADLPAFLRHILGTDILANRAKQINMSFDDFIGAHPHFTALQINFLRTVRSAVVSGANKRLTSEDIERPPFSRVGSAHALFNEDERREILDLANRFSAA